MTSLVPILLVELHFFTAALIEWRFFRHLTVCVNQNVYLRGMSFILFILLLFGLIYLIVISVRHFFARHGTI